MCRELDPYLPAPTTVTGRAPASYALFGIGTKPFDNYYTIPEDNGTELFFVKGTSVIAAEFLSFPSVELNPLGIIDIKNVSIARDALGFVNFTATFENVGTSALGGVRVGFGIPGNGQNTTSPIGFTNGVNATQSGPIWINDGLAQGLCVTEGTVAPSLLPGEECKASLLALTETVAPGQTFGYNVDVIAGLGTQGLVFRHWFQGVWPSKGVTSDWVGAFIQSVNANRTGPALVENKTLDAFAQTRFQTQAANSNISNYGFQQDFSKSFPGSAIQIGETTLWPGTQLPFEYAGFLQESAPGHWAVLTDSTYSQFGYYIGTGPIIVADQPCSVTEFPGGVNMTAMLTSHGCQFHIEQGVWLVIEVGT
jgi:hypothetical protein